ncbi:MAG: CGNR zinc finger domain-containing protein [Candidatus Limnocylindrales bacterium]
MNTVTWRLGPAAALGLANSQHGPGAHYRRRARPSEPPHDHLGTPDDALAFLSTHDIPTPAGPPGTAQLARLRSIRALIRALVDDPEHDPVTWRAAVEAALEGVDYRLRSDGSMRSASDGWDGITDDLLPAALELADEHPRLRTCGNPLCRWLFVDRSRNGSRVWCEMAVCGNRMKVGRHRLRPKATARAI